MIEEGRILEWLYTRSELYQKYEDSFNELTCEYELPLDPEVDRIADEVLNIFKKQIGYYYSPHFVIECLTKIGWSPSIIYDDNGHFAVTGDGYQSVSMTMEPADLDISFTIPKEAFFDNIYDALMYYLNHNEDEDDFTYSGVEDDDDDAFKKLVEWLLINKRSVFMDADLPKETKKKIMNDLGYSSNSLDE